MHFLRGFLSCQRKTHNAGFLLHIVCHAYIMKLTVLMDRCESNPCWRLPGQVDASFSCHYHPVYSHPVLEVAEDVKVQRSFPDAPPL